jgi:hypothetical protein
MPSLGRCRCRRRTALVCCVPPRFCYHGTATWRGTARSHVGGRGTCVGVSLRHFKAAKWIWMGWEEEGGGERGVDTCSLLSAFP